MQYILTVWGIYATILQHHAASDNLLVYRSNRSPITITAGTLDDDYAILKLSHLIYIIWMFQTAELQMARQEEVDSKDIDLSDKVNDHRIRWVII